MYINVLGHGYVDAHEIVFSGAIVTGSCKSASLSTGNQLQVDTLNH